MISSEIIKMKFWKRIKDVLTTNKDENTIAYLALLTTNITYRNGRIKEQLVDQGIGTLLMDKLLVVIQNNQLLGIQYVLSALSNLTTQKSTCDQVLLHHKMYSDLIRYFAPYVEKKEIVKSSLGILHNIYQFANDEKMKVLEKQQFQAYLRDIIMKWQNDEDVMDQFYWAHSVREYL